MEVISEPQYTEEPVRYLDIGFVGGQVYPLTLAESDKLEEDDNCIFVTGADGATFRAERRNILWASLRKATKRTLIKSSIPSTNVTLSGPTGISH